MLIYSNWYIFLCFWLTSLSIALAFAGALNLLLSSVIFLCLLSSTEYLKFSLTIYGQLFYYDERTIWLRAAIQAFSVLALVLFLVEIFDVFFPLRLLSEVRKVSNAFVERLIFWADDSVVVVSVSRVVLKLNVGRTEQLAYLNNS